MVFYCKLAERNPLSMKKIIASLAIIGICLSPAAQKKNKVKGKSETDKTAPTDYQQTEPVADTLTKFTGVIKYHMTTDDPSERDSMFVIVGETRIRVIMFYPGYKENDIFRDNMIANFTDSTFLVLDDRKKTYKTEKLGTRNAGTEITLANYRKTGKVLNYQCPEYSGEVIMKDGETFQASALISKQHSYIAVCDYNFMNIQPVVLGYKIVLACWTKSSDNENTYILAYKVEPGNTDSYFDLTGYKAL